MRVTVRIYVAVLTKDEFMFVRYFGFFLFAIGPFLVIKTEWFVENFGRIGWAEAHLQGGTRLFLKILGVGLMFFGMTMMLDMFGGMVMWVFGPLLPKK
jgi:hypothetical protein